MSEQSTITLIAIIITGFVIVLLFVSILIFIFLKHLKSLETLLKSKDATDYAIYKQVEESNEEEVIEQEEEVPQLMDLQSMTVEDYDKGK